MSGVVANTRLPALVVDAASAGDLVRITQTGTGNALKVEDSANPDSTPFVIDANGRVGIGKAADATNVVDVTWASAPTVRLLSTSGIPSLQLQSNNNAGSAEPRIAFIRRNASASTTPDSSVIADLRFEGIDAAPAYKLFAQITVNIGANVAGGAPTSMSFLTGSSGADPSKRLELDGSGNVVIGNQALATTATGGFLYVPTCAGSPTGVPTAYSGRAAIVYDTTNNRLCVYNGGWKTVTLA